jgi:hypothetical protein
MAKNNIQSTAEFLAQMRKTPLGSTTELTFGDAQVLSRAGIDVSNYGNESNEYVDELQKTENESQSWWDNIFGTIDNIANSFGKGFVSMFEGIIDFGVTLAGAVGSWFGADTQWAEDFVKVDMAGNLANFTETFANFTPWGIAKMIGNAVEYGDEYWKDFGEAWSSLGLGLWSADGDISDKEFEEWREKYAYGHDVLEQNTGWFGQGVLGLAEGAGQLVGMYVTAGAGGAAGLSTKAAQWLGLGAMSLGAAGKGSEQALEEGANIHQASLYGLLTGSVEFGTELIGGVGANFASGIIGKAALKNAAVKKFTSTLAGKMIAGFLSEGLEEVLSDVANPLLKKISYDYDMDLGGEYASGQFWAGLAQSFVIGGLLGAIGEGAQYYKLGKTTINGKQVGQQAAISYSEYADAKDDLTKAAKRLNKTFSQIVETEEIDISERTNIDRALEQVRTNPDLSETQRAKLEGALKKALDANTKYMSAQDNLLAELEAKGITAEDLQIEYSKKVNEQAKEVGEELGINVESTEEVNEAIKTNTEIMNQIENKEIGSFYDGDGKLVVVGDNAVAETTALESLKQLEIANNDIYSDVMAVADQLVTLDEEFASQVEKYTKLYQTQNGLSLDEATKLAKQTAMANRLAAFFKGKANALRKVDDLRKIADTMTTALTPMESGIESEVVEPEPMLPTETTNPMEVFNEEMGALVRTMDEPDLQKKIRVGKGAVKSTATWLQNISYQTETLAVKLSNSAAAIENAFRRFGDTQRHAMERTEKVRTARSIAADVSLNGFSAIDANKHVERITKGLYNGSTGIADILEKEFAGDLRGKARKDAISAGFSTFYESLALYVEQDRLNASLGTDLVTLEDVEKLATKEPKARKTVFGKWLETRTMPSDLLVKISEHFPKLSEAIEKGVAMDEATVNELTHKTATERSVELEGDALETYKELSKYLRLLNQSDIDTRLKQIDEEYPMFKEMREEVWKYNRQLLKMQYEGGYLTKAAYEWMQKNYSHYVPTYREMIMNATTGISMSMQSSTLKTAKGSDLVIKDMFDSMQMQTLKIHQKTALNELIKDLVNASKGYGQLNEYVISEEIKGEDVPRSTDSSMTYYLSRPALDGQVVTYYEGGQAHSYLVNANVMEGFQSLAGVYNDTLLKIPGMRFVAKAQKLVKNLLTTYNPFFGLRNAIRDLWDASFYSPTGMTSVLRNLPKAYKSIITNDIDYQTFVANGGIGTSIMTTEEIYTEKPKVSNKLEYVIKPWKAIERVNEIIEVATRYSQYLATTKQLFKERAKGLNSMSDRQIMTRGVYEAHEITLNFSRSGTVGRQINNTFGLFLNANIQGFTKMMRTFMAPKTVKDWAELILKCLILGITTQLLNELLYWDDEDYQSLNQSIKNNYYLIKAGDQFIRIPKGRVISAFNSIVSGAFGSAKGDNKIMEDSLHYALFDANSPIQGFTFGFFQAIDDASKNRTWYGGEIVSSKWDGTRPSEQYEKDTSYISRWIGKLTNTSPLVIEYVLDQYSGIVGDILLPMTSDEAGVYKLMRITKDQYLIDPVEKSKYSKDFYDYKQQVTYDKTDGDAIATIQVNYLTKAQSEIKELREQIKEVEASGKNDFEKAAETKAIQIMINASYKAAVENAKAIGEALKNYTITEENAAEVQREVYREVLGAESALRIYNKNVYAKAQCYYKAGVSYDDFYVYYFNMKNFATKDEAERYIVRLRVSPQLKNLIYALAGWNLGKEKIEVLTRWLKNKGLTDEEIDMIL